MTHREIKLLNYRIDQIEEKNSEINKALLMLAKNVVLIA